jgi:HK97 family phage prohead protease
MLERESRSFDLRLDSEGDGRTLVGVAVPYDSPAHIVDWRGEYDEVFRPRSLAKTIAERGDRLRIYYQHEDRMLPVGVASKLVDTREGALVHARISETTMGNDILTLARDGALNAFSVSFSITADGERWPTPDFREVTQAKLHEISIVNEPAYAGAVVKAIRAHEPAASAPTDDEEDAAFAARRAAAELLVARASLWGRRYNV